MVSVLYSFRGHSWIHICSLRGIMVGRAFVSSLSHFRQLSCVLHAAHPWGLGTSRTCLVVCLLSLFRFSFGVIVLVFGSHAMYSSVECQPCHTGRCKMVQAQQLGHAGENVRRMRNQRRSNQETTRPFLASLRSAFQDPEGTYGSFKFKVEGASLVATWVASQAHHKTSSIVFIVVWRACGNQCAREQWHRFRNHVSVVDDGIVCFLSRQVDGAVGRSQGVLCYAISITEKTRELVVLRHVKGLEP
mmetsp:Transcript_31529/g.72529  ORF Transcript_31529/g.72529 Transcript_31529/m.72529 type:complete len:246 (+) Transcript_31529:458-1195(+)